MFFINILLLFPKCIITKSLFHDFISTFSDFCCVINSYKWQFCKRACRIFVLRLMTLVRLSPPLAYLEIRFGINRFGASPSRRLACTFARCHLLVASVKLHRSDLYTLFIADVGFSPRGRTRRCAIEKMNSKETRDI